MKPNINYNDPSPLYEQIKKNIKKKIESDELKEGEKIGSNNELARYYDVSLITIKKAVSSLVADGVLYTRIGKGTYVASKNNWKLDHSKVRNLGLVIRNLNHPFFSMIIPNIEARANALGYNILISSSADNLVKEENQINHFKNLGVDGLIIASFSLEYRATNYIKELHEQNFPYIMISYMHDPNYWYVGSDHEYGAYLATSHLAELGYKTIGYVHGGEKNILGEVRRIGYEKAMVENDLPINRKNMFYLDPLEYDMARYESGESIGKKFLKLKNRPRAMFIYSDSAALGFMSVLLENGISIPGDVAVVGFNDIKIAQYSAVPLTTIHQPIDEIGKLAVDTIHKRINDEQASSRIILKPSLVIRKSCGASQK
ncbi:MAG: hypothetical protein CVV23_01265 [Ignavibacteriae bacterium HGW-Ignavibacteriae-2]|jgi:DNA-binding LacI/PurR family transcriptional regulator|nr:MAG: hypothetical protein CVV23_01265 [Ignavibacteriae bacterium HGW-Ignavibacteriae-2]